MKNSNDKYIESLQKGTLEQSDLEFMAECADQLDDVQYDLDNAREELAAAQKDFAELAELRQFFVDCFYALRDDYPCPSISSDYDKSIILDSIRTGDKVLARVADLERDTMRTDDEALELRTLKEVTL